MKALQRRSHFLFPPEKRGRAHESFIRQNAFARRNGVRILTWVFNLILAYIVIGFVFLAVVELNDRGYFTLPDRIARRAHAD